MIIKKSEFIKSVTEGINEYQYPEIAFVGKSNVGKSSLINFLCNRKNLAKTSQNPGKTRLINLFLINDGMFMFVDLPGYGYAKVSKDEQQKWGKMIENYLQNSKSLKHIFLLVDIRHEPTQADLQMVAYMHHFQIPFSVIATKSDKLSKSAIFRHKQAIATKIGIGVDNINTVSSTKKTGKEEILNKIEVILNE